jgi:hypothetical protein
MSWSSASDLLSERKTRDVGRARSWYDGFERMYLDVDVSINPCCEVCRKEFTHLSTNGFTRKVVRPFVSTVAKTDGAHVESVYD